MIDFLGKCVKIWRDLNLNMNGQLDLSKGNTHHCEVPNLTLARQILANRGGKVVSALKEAGHAIDEVSLIEGPEASNVIEDLRGRVHALFASRATRAINIAAAQPGTDVYDELGPLREARVKPFQVAAVAGKFALKNNSRIGGASALYPSSGNMTGEVFLSPQKGKGHDYAFVGNREGDVDPQVLKRSADLSILLQGGVFTDQSGSHNNRLVVAMKGGVTPAAITYLSRLLGVDGPTVFRMFAMADQVDTQAIETFPGTRIEAVDTADLLGQLKATHIFANRPLTQTTLVESVGLRDYTPYTQNGHFHGAAALPRSGEVISGGHLNSVSGTAYVSIDPVHAVYRLAYSL